MIELPNPRAPADDEVLIRVEAAGVGNWDEFVRSGEWDVGRSPPMALGVEAAGTVAAVGGAVSHWAAGDDVMTHPLPLRDQGTWAPALIAPAALLAAKPPGLRWEAAAVFPVPALTADQALAEALAGQPGDRLLDGDGLRALARLLADGQLEIAAAMTYGADEAAAALAAVVGGRAGGGVALRLIHDPRGR